MAKKFPLTFCAGPALSQLRPVLDSSKRPATRRRSMSTNRAQCVRWSESLPASLSAALSAEEHFAPLQPGRPDPEPVSQFWQSKTAPHAKRFSDDSPLQRLFLAACFRMKGHRMNGYRVNGTFCRVRTMKSCAVPLV